jgi:hypothetical protein
MEDEGEDVEEHREVLKEKEDVEELEDNLLI